MRKHKLVLSPDHGCKPLHLTKILFLTKDLQILFRTHLARAVLRGLVLQVSVLLLDFRQLSLQLLLLVYLVVVLLLQLLDLILQIVELVEMLLSLLFECLDLFLLICQLKLQTLVLILRAVQILLQLSNLLLEALLFPLRLTGHVCFLIIILLCLHPLHVQVYLEIDALQ